jgi:predicted ATPase/class 3 adenylate cyclase
MRELPHGTVTFLFTDVEGSTRLLHELGDAYAAALDEHRTALRECFGRHGGVEVDTQGDAFFVAFAKASDALAAAIDGQVALEPGPIRVRMGLHTGEPLVTEEGYVGIDVHRAARIAAVGYGGQILVSRATRDLVGPDSLRDLGEHRLKDLTAPERIYQLGDEDFPPLKSLNRTNLPVAATPLVGRERELAELRDLLTDSARLVTLTGAGGSGKTRLALQVAAELIEDFPGGVFFVPLAPVQDAAFVVPAIAQAAGVREVDELAGAEALLLLDNLEHLLPAATELSSLLGRAPQVKLLVTSRVRLRVAGEQEFALDPLPHDEAVAFFVERAQAVRRDIRADEAVGEICRRLDGLPLALELAASRVKVLEPSILRERLERRLPLLTGGTRDAPERQQTLHATIEWSYELLEPSLQRAFRRLAVFAGSFSLDAAESVTDTSLEEIATLVDWSLLKPIGEGRFLMLETIREYGVELLDANGESDELRDRHLGFFLDLVEEAEPKLTGAAQRQWYDRLALEQDNVRDALSYACSAGDGERALMLAGTIWRYWASRGQIAEALQWYERAFAVAREVSATARARALHGSGEMATLGGELERARGLFEEAAGLFRQTGEIRWLILVLNHLGNVHQAAKDLRRAEALYEEALALARESADVRNVAMITTNLGYQRLLEGDDDGAAELFEESLESDRARGDVYGVAIALENLALVALRRGDVEAAAHSLSESIALSHSIGDVRALTHTLSLAAVTVLDREDASTTTRLLAATQMLCSAHGFELEGAERDLADGALSRVRPMLGPDAFTHEWSRGADLDLDAAVAEALRALD